MNHLPNIGKTHLRAHTQKRLGNIETFNNNKN